MSQVESAPGPVDLALLRAIRAWGGGDLSRWSSRFSKNWGDRLASSWGPIVKEKPSGALSALRSEHEASARPDLARVHPSWFVRILKSESPAVRLAVVAHSTQPLREVLVRGLGIDRSELATDREHEPEALRWALSLWGERLLGDVAAHDSDPPVVVAMTKLGPRHLAHLVRACGVVKYAFAVVESRPSGFDDSVARFTTLDRVRLGYFRRHIGVADPRLVSQAKLDLGVIEGDRRRGLARLGLVTFGRLLAAVEPYRARWASQHLPYPVARLLRRKETSPISSNALLTWESWVLEAAWLRLLGEGRLTGGRPSTRKKNSEARP